VADGKGHRVVTLLADGIDLNLLQQYADARALDAVVAVAFAPDLQTLYAMTDSALIAIRLPGTVRRCYNEEEPGAVVLRGATQRPAARRTGTGVAGTI